MTDICIVPYNPFSQSVREIVKASDGKIKRYKFTMPRKYKHFIYWGKPVKYPSYPVGCRIYNMISHSVINKEKFFHFAKDQAWCVPHTTSLDVVDAWLSEGKKVVGRQTLTGKGGEGIVILDPEKDGAATEGTIFCKLFTKYIPKDKEYRIHVINGKIIKIQQKVMVPGNKPKNGWEVRSHDNGFIFQGVDLDNVPEVCLNAALESIAFFGLDFGGCDVIYNKKSNKAYVLEINSAPGVEGDTAVKYAQALVEMCNTI